MLNFMTARKLGSSPTSVMSVPCRVVMKGSRRTGASIEFAIARQFVPTGVFDIARRRPRTPAPGQMALF